MTTLSQYIRHAEKFGVDCVMQTAREQNLSTSELAALGAALVRVAVIHRKNRMPTSWSAVR